MKAPNLHGFLEECRAANTSDEIGGMIDLIESRIATMRAARGGMEGQLQDVILAGRDPGKIHTAIAQLDQDLMTLEAAQAGFSQKQTDARKAEADRETQALADRHVQEGKALEAAARDFADIMEKARMAGSLMASVAKQHDRTTVELESRKQRPGKPASGIIRETIGEVRRGEGITEYGRRVDIALEGVLTDNPSHMRRAQILRRGRFGESNQARDMATEGWMKLAKG
jgi:hypothetical protein